MPPSLPIALLYQALDPPVIGGLRKAPKPGGYSDSGADIGFALKRAGRPLVTPVAAPDPERPFDWVFPDTPEGIAAARANGAAILWANTVLFAGHPVETVMADIWIIGQQPVATQMVDDKFATNRMLAAAGLPVAPAILVGGHREKDVLPLGLLTGDSLREAGIGIPAVVKPVRGRGSQGVSVAPDFDTVRAAVRAVIETGDFGDKVIVERFLPGAEITVAVMPPDATRPAPWALPPVWRFDHVDGVAPYNGTVPVTANSRAVTPDERAAEPFRAVEAACTRAAALLDIRNIARIDCRADADGRFFLFDFNMKPNLTGAGRPGREDQDSLVTLAAAAADWTYADLLDRLIRTAWREVDGQVIHIG